MSGYFLRLLARASTGSREDAAALGFDEAVAEGDLATAPDVVRLRRGVRDGGLGEPARAATARLDEEAASFAARRGSDPLDGPQAAIGGMAQPAPAAQHSGEASLPRAHSAAQPEMRRAVEQVSATLRSGEPVAPATAGVAQPAPSAPFVQFPEPLFAPVAARHHPSLGIAAAPAVSPAAVTIDPAPAVHITIGRVEVVATPPAPAAAPARADVSKHAPQSLDAYLALRALAR